MQLGPITPNDLPTGTVSAWLPGDSSLTPDPRQPSPDQRHRVATFAKQPCEEHDSNNPWIGWKIELPQSDAPTISRVLQQYVGMHEALRTGFTLVEGQVARHGIRANPEWHPQVLAVSESPGESFEIMTAYLHKQVRPVGWPNYAFLTIEGDDGSTTLIGAFDHVIYDGMSAYAALSEVPRLHEAISHGREIPRALPSHNDHAHTQACTCSTGTDHADIGKWRRIIKNGNLSSLPTASGVPRDARLPLETCRTRIATPEEAHAFKNTMRQHGIREGAAFCSTFLHAISQLGDHDIDFLLSTHGRPGAEWFNSVGWFASLVPVALDLSQASNLVDVARMLQEDQNDTAGSTPLATVAEVLDLPLQPSLVISYLKASAFPGSDEWGTRKEKAVIACPPPSSQMHVWISLMRSGLNLDVRYPKNPTSQVWVRDLATHMQGAIQESIRQTETTEANRGDRPWT